MKADIVVKEVPLEEAVKVGETVVEFGETYPKSYYEDRYGDSEHLIIVGYVDGQPAGYIVGYNRDDDGSFYCWMAGVNPLFRGKGVLKELMAYQLDWAKNHGYTKIRITTRNNRRSMLTYLVKYGFLFTEVTPADNMEENRIHLEKPI